MPEENTYQEEMSQEAQVDKQRETAVKVLAGFGARVHMGDMVYAQKINELQNSICGVSADKVECMIVLMKFREHIDEDPMKDRFNLVGGTMGTEPEMTALLIALAADISKFRLQIAAQLVAKEQKNGDTDIGQSSQHLPAPEGDDVQGTE